MWFLCVQDGYRKFLVFLYYKEHLNSYTSIFSMTNIKQIDEDCAKFIEQFSVVYDYSDDKDLSRKVINIAESFDVHTI